MIGMVLAAGAGRRLGDDTADLPKTLLPVAGERTILDIALHNLAGVGLTDVVVVTGFAAHQIDNRIDALQRRHGVRIRTVFNDKATVGICEAFATKHETILQRTSADRRPFALHSELLQDV